MGYDYVILNHTKRQYIAHKVLARGFERQDYLLEYLKNSVDCSIEIIGEEEAEFRKEYQEYDDKSWWNHPTGGDVESDDFIDFFER